MAAQDFLLRREDVEEHTALEALHARGAHFVLTATDKRPLWQAWQTARPDFSNVDRHAQGDGLVGVVPASLKCFVVDIDQGGENGVEAVRRILGKPVAVIATKRPGGFHAWYRAAAGDIGNRKWGLGDAGGDIRGSRGFAILWDPSTLADALAQYFDDAQPADPGRLRRPATQGKRGPEAVRTAPVGARNDTLNREVFWAAKDGTFDWDAVRDAAIDAGLPAGEVETTLASAAAAGTAAAKRQLPRNAAGLAAALTELGIAWRFNVRSRHHEFREAAADWREANDRTEARIQEAIANRYVTGEKHAPLRFGREAWQRSLNALFADAETDPFLDWVEAQSPWDGTSRLDGWLNEVFETDPNCPLTAWAARFVFLGPVWRAYEPGTKMDEMPVLIGPQDCGKSTALRCALPPQQPDWFSDGLHLAADPKTRAEALQSRVIAEAAEMAGSTRAELESLKSFLSRTDDGAVRLAYRRNPETALRRCIIVGTSNDRTCLPNDPSGNRRFVSVVLRGGDPTALRVYLNERREQLWAEALAAYRNGVEARLPDDLHEAQSATNAQVRRRDDILEDTLADWLRSDPKLFTLADAAVGCGLVDHGREARLSMRDQRRLGAALTTAGFVKRRERVDGQRVMVWARQ